VARTFAADLIFVEPGTGRHSVPVWRGGSGRIVDAFVTGAVLKQRRRSRVMDRDPLCMTHSNRPSILVATLALTLGFAATLAVTGCTQVQVAPETRGEYKFGELQVFVDHDFKSAHTAAKSALKDVGLFETRDDVKVIEAELNGRDSTDTLVIVKIKEVAKNRTSVKIRYGVMTPNLASAQKLFAAIEKRL
jgi:hypothetical protein